LQVPQQPTPPPELQSSPLGRHESARSSSHRLAVHLPEQQSAPTAQLSPLLPHAPAAHEPATQLSEQQSCARVHAPPTRLQ
jgi:hypothetical protein